MKSKNKIDKKLNLTKKKEKQKKKDISLFRKFIINFNMFFNAICYSKENLLKSFNKKNEYRCDELNEMPNRVLKKCGKKKIMKKEASGLCAKKTSTSLKLLLKIFVGLFSHSN